MQIIKKLISAITGDAPHSAWVDENGAEVVDIFTELNKGKYAFYADATNHIISDLGLISGWLHRNGKTNELTSPDGFTGTELYIVDDVPQYIAHTFNSDMKAIYLSAPGLNSSSEAIPLEWQLKDNAIVIALAWPAIEAQIYAANMAEATGYIDQWEDLVEIGHATANQKAFWGQWKTYRASYRNWFNKVPGFDKEPVKPVATEPAPENTTTTS